MKKAVGLLCWTIITAPDEEGDSYQGKQTHDEKGRPGSNFTGHWIPRQGDSNFSCVYWVVIAGLQTRDRMNIQVKDGEQNELE